MKVDPVSTMDCNNPEKGDGRQDAVINTKSDHNHHNHRCHHEKKEGETDEQSHWRHFVEHTSCHGVFQIQNSATKVGQIVWSIIVFASTVILILMIYQRIDEYYQYKTTTQSTRDMKIKMELPSITMCNCNRYFQNGLTNGTIVNPISDEEIAEQQALSTLYDLSFQYYGPNGSLLRPLPEFPILRSKLNDTYTLRDYQLDHGWMKTPALFPFSMAGRVPLNATIKTYLSWKYGTCATIEPNFIMVGPGSIYGILVGLDSKLDYYLESFLGNLEGGIKFQVHPKDVPPYIESFGVSVGAAMQASVDVAKELIHLQPRPWGQCNENIKKLKYYDTYSRSACLIECQEGEIIEACGCRGPTFRTHDDYPECHLDQLITCMIPIIGRLQTVPEGEELVGGCDCPMPCKMEKYDISLSYGTFPTQAFMSYIDNIPQDPNAAQFSNQDYNKRNLLLVNLYYGSLSELVHKESKAVDVSGLFSDIGGTMGLFLGISVITMFELTQFLLHAIYATFAQK